MSKTWKYADWDALRLIYFLQKKFNYVTIFTLSWFISDFFHFGQVIFWHSVENYLIRLVSCGFQAIVSKNFYEPHHWSVLNLNPNKSKSFNFKKFQWKKFQNIENSFRVNWPNQIIFGQIRPFLTKWYLFWQNWTRRKSFQFAYFQVFDI